MSEQIELPDFLQGRVLIIKAWDGWSYHLECAAPQFKRPEDGYQRFPDPVLVDPAKYTRSVCNVCRKPLIAASSPPPALEER